MKFYTAQLTPENKCVWYTNSMHRLFHQTFLIVLLSVLTNHNAYNHSVHTLRRRSPTDMRPSLSATPPGLILIIKILGSPSICSLLSPPATLNPRPEQRKQVTQYLTLFHSSVRLRNEWHYRREESIWRSRIERRRRGEKGMNPEWGQGTIIAMATDTRRFDVK